MGKIIFDRIVAVDAGVVSNPYLMIRVLDDARDKISSKGSFVIFCMLKINGADTVIERDAIPRAESTYIPGYPAGNGRLYFAQARSGR